MHVDYVQVRAELAALNNDILCGIYVMISDVVYVIYVIGNCYYWIICCIVQGFGLRKRRHMYRAIPWLWSLCECLDRVMNS